MVRLKVASDNICVVTFPSFTFQYGSIKSDEVLSDGAALTPFTFQYGSIKSGDSYASSASVSKFTFQYGSIKSLNACF